MAKVTLPSLESVWKATSKGLGYREVWIQGRSINAIHLSFQKATQGGILENPQNDPSLLLQSLTPAVWGQLLSWPAGENEGQPGGGVA